MKTRESQNNNAFLCFGTNIYLLLLLGEKPGNVCASVYKLKLESNGFFVGSPEPGPLFIVPEFWQCTQCPGHTSNY